MGLFGPGYVQRCILAFILLTILSLVFDGLWISNTDYGVIQTMTWFSGKGYAGFIIPFVAFAGFIASLPQMIAFDYAWLHSLGPAGMLIRIILFAFVSIGFVWGFITMLWPIMAQLALAIAKGIVGLISRI